MSSTTAAPVSNHTTESRAKRKVVTQGDFQLSDILISQPQKLQDQLFARVRVPLLQTECMTFAKDDKLEQITAVCSDAYADLVSSIDDHICNHVSMNSASWFGKAIPHDNVESMMQASLIGHRHPQQTFDVTKCHCFTVDQSNAQGEQCLVECDVPMSGSATMLVRCDGILFNKTSCELLWSTIQMRCETHTDTTADDDEDEDDDAVPMFL